jgi:hypothetical protein
MRTDTKLFNFVQSLQIDLSVVPELLPGVVTNISATAYCENLGSIVSELPGWPNSAINRRTRAKRDGGFLACR